MKDSEKLSIELEARNRRMLEFFDRKADGYDDVHLKMMDNKSVIADALPPNTEKILDLGIGTGLELIPIYEKFPDIEVTGIDISEKMLNELEKRSFMGKLNLICADFFSAEYGVNYNAVISSAALHHFDENGKARLYKKIFDCLTPCGVFINSDRFVNTQEEQDALIREYIATPDLYPHMDTPLTPENETMLLKAAGFTDINFKTLPDERYKLLTAKK